MRKSELEVGGIYAVSEEYGNRSPSSENYVSKVEVLYVDAPIPGAKSWEKTTGIMVKYLKPGKFTSIEKGETRVHPTARRFFGEWDSVVEMFARFEREREEAADRKAAKDARKQRDLATLDEIGQALGYDATGGDESLTRTVGYSDVLDLGWEFSRPNERTLLKLIRRAYDAGRSGQDLDTLLGMAQVHGEGA